MGICPLAPGGQCWDDVVACSLWWWPDQPSGQPQPPACWGFLFVSIYSDCMKTPSHLAWKCFPHYWALCEGNSPHKGPLIFRCCLCFWPEQHVERAIEWSVNTAHKRSCDVTPMRWPRCGICCSCYCERNQTIKQALNLSVVTLQSW